MKAFFKTSLVLLTILLSSCNLGIKGNGIVKKESRKVTGYFTAIKASNGLNVLLTEATNHSIQVEADENLLDLIKTEIKDSTLHIFTTENIGSAKAKDIYVSLALLKELTASSGSNISTNSTFSSEHTKVKISSGASIELRLIADSISSEASSGASLTLSGKTKEHSAKASSGAAINATSLQAEAATVKASSGASVIINSTKILTVNANSGAFVNYIGSPPNIKLHMSSGGKISKKIKK